MLQAARDFPNVRQHLKGPLAAIRDRLVAARNLSDPLFRVAVQSLIAELDGVPGARAVAMGDPAAGKDPI